MARRIASTSNMVVVEVDLCKRVAHEYLKEDASVVAVHYELESFKNGQKSKKSKNMK